MDRSDWLSIMAYVVHYGEQTRTTNMLIGIREGSIDGIVFKMHLTLAMEGLEVL